MSFRPLQDLFRRLVRLFREPSSPTPIARRANRRHLCVEYLEDRRVHSGKGVIQISKDGSIGGF